MGWLKEAVNSTTFDAAAVFVPALAAAFAIWHRFFRLHRRSFYASPPAIMALTALTIVLGYGLNWLHTVLSAHP